MQNPRWRRKRTVPRPAPPQPHSGATRLASWTQPSTIISVLSFAVSVLVGVVAVLSFQLSKTASEGSRSDAVQQIDLDRSKQAADRFSRAMEDLGASSAATRTSALYSLDQLMTSSPQFTAVTVAGLAAFVRSEGNAKPPKLEAPTSADVKEAVRILGSHGDESNFPYVNLSGAELRGVSLHGLSLPGASFVGADLRDSDLQYADLRGATFANADLRGAFVSGANLTSASFFGAHLTRVLMFCADTDDSLGLPAINIPQDMTMNPC